MENAIKEMGKMDFGTPPRAIRSGAMGALLATAAVLVALIGAAPARAANSDYSLKDESASVSTSQARAHSDFVTKFNVSGNPIQSGGFGQHDPWGRFRDVGFQLPPGLLGNPAGFPSCDSATFVQQTVNQLLGPPPVLCPSDSQIGIASPGLFGLFPAGLINEPLFNLTPPAESDIVARLGFIGVFYPIFIDVRLDAKREYALTIKVVNSPNVLPVTGTNTTVWGTPTDHSHDFERFSWYEAIACFGPCEPPVESGLDPTPYFSNPSSCGPVDVSMTSDSYQDPGEYFSVSPMGSIDGCDQVPFEPRLSLQPTTRSASASSGVDLNLEIPQNGWEDPEALASADLKKAVVKMPEGVSLNPSSADGLEGCSESQIGTDWSEEQIVAIQSGGAAVKLTFGGQSTPELPYLASAAQVQGALEGLPNIGAGNVAVRGRDGGPWTVDFGGALAKSDVPQIEGVASAVDRVDVKSAFSLTIGGDTTVALPKQVAAGAVKSALEVLPSVGAGNVDVIAEQGPEEAELTEYVGYVFHIAFKNGRGGVSVPALTSSTGIVERLSQGGSPVVSRTVKQGGTLGFTGAEPTCPHSAKVGSGTIVTPILPDPIEADLYIAKQGENPFNSLVAGYLVAHGHGVLIKVAGRFDLDPNTGQIVGTFDGNPQSPFSDLELHFKGGNRGVITTPKQCGTYKTEYELVPWSGNEPVTGVSEFTLDENCDPKPFAPGFDAGSSSPLAGGFTSFNVKVTRESGSPALSGIAVEPPQGLTGRLAGIPYCSNAALASISSAPGTGAAQLAAPSCPAASQIGTSSAGAGSGSPFYVNTGKVYLAGPYKGAPISMAVLTPAVAGPFDLGNVLIRTPIYINPETAQIRAVSDPLPTILSGIPLDLRDVRVSLDRQGFAVNPTSCEPMAVNGQISGTGNAAANVSDRFQVGECAALGFKPKLALKLKGGTTRGKHPALTAVLRARSGDANIASISVAFPSAEFLDQSHIKTVCTRVQFAAEQCPAASVYGKVSATSPLLEAPLTGNVYLRSSSHTLPDLVTDLHGPANQPIHLDAAGRNDSVHGGLRNTFEFIPDAPLSRVVLKMQGGKKGLLQNSTNICAKTYRAHVAFTAHNGRRLETEAPLQAHCGGKGRHKAKANHHRHG